MCLWIMTDSWEESKPHILMYLTVKTSPLSANTISQSAIRLAVLAALVVMEIDDLLASNASSIDIYVCFKKHIKAFSYILQRIVPAPCKTQSNSVLRSRIHIRICHHSSSVLHAEM